MEKFDEKKLKKELLIHAKAVDIPIGAAEEFIKKTLESVKKELKNKKIITNLDLERIVTKELKKYNANLAYVYQKRDKII